jgi:hypothetical protein
MPVSSNIQIFRSKKEKRKNKEIFACKAGKNHPAVEKLVNFAVPCY